MPTGGTYEGIVGVGVGQGKGVTVADGLGVDVDDRTRSGAGASGPGIRGVTLYGLLRGCNATAAMASGASTDSGRASRRTRHPGLGRGMVCSSVLLVEDNTQPRPTSSGHGPTGPPWRSERGGVLHAIITHQG